MLNSSPHEPLLDVLFTLSGLTKIWQTLYQNLHKPDTYIFLTISNNIYSYFDFKQTKFFICNLTGAAVSQA